MDKEEAIKRLKSIKETYAEEEGKSVYMDIEADDIEAIETLLQELENSISKDKIREIFNNKYKILKEMNNNFVAEVVFAHYESLEEELLLGKG